MTWLYVPSVCAPALVASTLASESLDPTRAASLSWRGKHQQPQAWSRAWKRGGFIRLLSGLTCEPSTLEHGAAQWIASFREIPVKETALPESGSASSTTDGCSIAPSKSTTKAGLIPSSARTSSGISTANSPLPFRHWSDWAVALRAEYSARPRPERATDASGSSSWPSATVGDSRNAANSTAGRNRPASAFANADTLVDAVRKWPTPDAGLHNDGEEPATFLDRQARLRAKGINGNGMGFPLAMAVKVWSTPKASDGEKGGPNMRGSKGNQPLPAQAAHWPTPLTADDGRKVTARSAQPQHCKVAEAWPDPHSRPDQPTRAGGRSSPERRRLNPLFVEWLMGWPEGLSGFDTAATASCRSPQPSPGCGCMDCWLNKQREMLCDLLTIEPPAQGVLL